MTELRKKIMAAMLVSMAIAGCSKHSSQDKEEPDASGPEPEVTAAKVQRAPITQNLIVSGNLTALPNRDAKVAALVPGRIAHVLVVEGDQVKEGDPLADNS